MFRAIAVLGLACALLCGLAPAQKPPPRGKQREGPPTLACFAGDLAAAQARAKLRNVPIVAIAILDGEPDNDKARADLLKSEALAAMSQGCVLFFSNHGQHAQVEITEPAPDGGEPRKRKVCSQYRTANCAEHQQHWDEIYNGYNVDGELNCPQALILMPDGALLHRTTPGIVPTEADIETALNLARAELGRGMDDAAMERASAAEKRGRAAEAQGKHGSAWRAFAEVLAESPDGPLAASAKQGQARNVAALDAARTSATAKLAEGDGLAGYLELEALAADWRGAPQVTDVERVMRQALKQPALKESLARKRREDEAQALWIEAEALKAAKPKEHERKVRTLLRKYAGTAAHAAAAKAYPDWATTPAQG